MKIAFFYPCLTQELGCGTSSFIQGISYEFIKTNHEVHIFTSPNEPTSKPGQKTSSFMDLLKDNLTIQTYDQTSKNLRDDLLAKLDSLDLVIVHESTSPQIIHWMGQLRKNHQNLRILFHDHDHKIFTEPNRILNLDLTYFDGILTSREETQQMYLNLGLTSRSWIWPEAICRDYFKPIPVENKRGDLVHTGIHTRTDYECSVFQEHVLSPLRNLRLGIKLYGRFTPQYFSADDYRSQIYFRGLIPHQKIPLILAHAEATFFTPKTPPSRSTPTRPSMQLLEALACGVPLISTHWEDSESFFTPGKDYLVTNDKSETEELIRLLQGNSLFRSTLITHGQRTIASRFSAEQRALDLKHIYTTLLPPIHPHIHCNSSNPATGPYLLPGSSF